MTRDGVDVKADSVIEIVCERGGGDGAPEGDFVLDQLVSGLLATPCIRRRLDQHYKSELQVIKEGLPELPELPPISGGALD